MRHDHHDEHEGLAQDLRKLAVDRRRILQLLAGAGLMPLIGCGANALAAAAASSTGDGGTAAADGGSDTDAGSSCAVIPEETGGPYPGDGTNGPDTLTADGIVRSDIRSSFGTMSGVAEGIPLTIKLKVVDVAAGCTALAGAAIYLWHCDRDGHYSLYTAADQNYLRGVQEADDDGTVTFTSIFPACYSGRWPHVHFEVYPSLADAASASNRIKTSQLAMPIDACNAVYATDGYSESISNLKQISLATDNVFSDGTTLQIPTISGDVTDGYAIALNVGVNV